jgi:hypothetical protein
MDFRWRADHSLTSYDHWRSKIAKKDDAPGRSARSLAMAWTGPVNVASALAHHETLRGLRVLTVSVEAQTAFDSFPGGKRNHDLLITGATQEGSVVISVESKADETFGQSVERYLDDASKLRESGKSTNAPERLAGLIDALLAKGSLKDEPVLALRYQLLSGLAGAIAAATERHADAAVFFVQEFITDSTTHALHSTNSDDLSRLGTTVFGVEFPAKAEPPWCVGPLPLPG